MELSDRLQEIERALSVLRVPATPGEYDLHRMIAEALRTDGIEFDHEVSLGLRCRIDFLSDDIGIEVKKGPVSARRLREQATRYLRFERVQALMLVTTHGAALPSCLAGKPVCILGLSRLWGVSLP